MNSRNRMPVLQRTLAIVSAAGTAALMALPAFAQTTPTTGVVNNGDATRSSDSMSNQAPTSDRCGSYVNGGVGGPVNSQSSSQAAPSSYDSARTGLSGSTGSNTTQMSNSNNGGQSMNQNMMGSTDNSGMRSSMMNQPRYQFDGNNRSAAIAYRANGPAGTSGHESQMNLDAYQERQNAYPTAYNPSSPQASTMLPVACAPR